MSAFLPSQVRPPHSHRTPSPPVQRLASDEPLTDSPRELPTLDHDLERATRFGHRLDTMSPRLEHSPRGSGKPLPQQLQARMEAAFQANFSNVRIHEGPQAPELGALAFTQGEHIHFAPGQYAPDTSSGQQMLGHELAHVMQQRAGRVVAQGQGVPLNTSPGLEAEADQHGKRAAAGQQAAPAQGHDSPARTAPSTPQAPIQRIPITLPSGKKVDTDRLPRRKLERYIRSVKKQLGKNPITDIRLERTYHHLARALSDRVHQKRLLVGEADLSYARALISKHPKTARSLTATTYESAEQLQGLYGDRFARNKRALEESGVTVLHQVDATRLEEEPRINTELGIPQIHFNFPRPPGRNSAVSQALISDSLKSFGRVQRPGQEVHLSLPRSAAYPRKGERKRIYGVEKALAPSGYKPFKRRRNIEGRYGPYGYVHKRTTQNKSADVASQAAEYIFKRRALHERPPALNVNLSDDESDSGSEKEEE